MNRIIKAYLHLVFIASLVYVKNFTGISGIENIATVLLWIHAILMFAISFTKSDKKDKLHLIHRILGTTIYYGTAFALIYFDDIALGVLLIIAGLIMLAKKENSKDK